MKNILIICLLILPTIVSAQSRLRPLPGRLRSHRGLRQLQQSQQLEPLLPFAEAVEKAKANDPQGWYALAIHYAKGEEIELDLQKARQFMVKASNLNYGNAVFAVAMMLDADSATAEDYIQCFGTPLLTPPIDKYLGKTHFRVWNSPVTLSITNATDIAKIRAEYERAFKLGVSAATNELARFEQRVKEYQEKATKENIEAERKAKNAKLIEGLL